MNAEHAMTVKTERAALRHMLGLGVWYGAGHVMPDEARAAVTYRLEGRSPAPRATPGPVMRSPRHFRPSLLVSKKTMPRIKPAPVPEPPAGSLKAILHRVAREYRLDPEVLTGDRRTRDVVAARQAFFVAASNETTASIAAIGRFANRHHSTVLHHIRIERKKAKARGFKILVRARAIEWTEDE